MSAANSLNLPTDEFVPIVIQERIRVKSRSGKIYRAIVKDVHYEGNIKGIEVSYVDKSGSWEHD